MSPRRTPVTLEKLFDRFVRFEENVNARFEHVDSRFNQVDVQFKNVAHYMFALEDTFKKEIARLDGRLNEVGKILEKLAGDLESLRLEYHMIVEALRRLEARLQSLDAIEARQDDLRTDLSALAKRVSELESSTPGLKG